MISFACKKISMDDLVKCSFELTKTSYQLMLFLLKKHKYLTINEIADELKLDRTTIQKSMSVLLEKNIVQKKQLNLDKGGYVYIYVIDGKDDIKKRMIDILEKWHKDAVAEIKDW